MHTSFGAKWFATRVGRSWFSGDAAAQSRVERLAGPAIEVAAWHLWRYSVPAAELQRLAGMRSLAEARVALEFRRRQGEAFADHLLALSLADDELEERLTAIGEQHADVGQFLKRIHDLRSRQWNEMRWSGLPYDAQCAIALQLNAIYTARLDQLLAG